MYYYVVVFGFAVLFHGVHHVTSRCNGPTLYTNSQGRIDTGNTSRSTCDYEIRTQPYKYLQLRWRSFHVDGTMPYCYDASVVIRTGCGYRKKVAEFCSRNMYSLPHTIYSPDQCIHITFKNNLKSRGFVASYQTLSRSQMPSPRSCSSSLFGGKVMTKPSGLISSPGWPLQRSSKMPSSSCYWTIDTRDSGKRITVNTMDMDMAGDSSTTNCAYSYDNVKIRGEKSITTKSKKLIAVLCRNGLADNTIMNTEYYKVTVRMRISSRSTFKRRGFILGYVVYEDATARAMTKWVMIVGGAGAILIFVIFLFCCYRRHQRQRRMNEQQPLVIHPGTTVIQPPAGSYPTQPPGAYPTQPPGSYPTQYAPPVNPLYANPAPYGYPDKPPPYAPPPYPSQEEAPPPGYPPVQPYPQAYPPPGYPAQPAPPH